MAKTKKITKNVYTAPAYKGGFKSMKRKPVKTKGGYNA